MKKALALLSCLILLTNASPCFGEGLDDCSETEVAVWDLSNSSEHDETDDCGSSCGCACCNIPAISLSLEIENPMLSFDILNVREDMIRLSSMAIPIWQPPKI